jgi:hypothetical protein
MDAWFERRDSDDPWRGRQPKFERLVFRGDHEFALAARLPSGEPVEVPLAPFRWDGEDGFAARLDDPQP